VIPSGRTPTTHILKPGIPGLDGSAENEHFCLQLARAVGLPAARSEGIRFGDELAIVVTRYDRVGVGPGAARVHQEDLCQALGVHPSRKYQNEGGPTPRQIVDVLRNHSTDSVADVQSFIQALAFNWVIAGTDAHAKNYSLLIGRGGRARLAPLYDVASALPYPAMQLQKLKLAMKVGVAYRLRDVQRDRWQQLAKDLGLAPQAVLSSVRGLVAEVAEQSEPVLEACLSAGLGHPLLPWLHSALIDRARACARLLGR